MGTSDRRRWAIPGCLVIALLFVGCKPAPHHSSVVVFGIDGATWTVIGPLLRRGELPHLHRLMEHGSWAQLASIEPSYSPAIWTSIATGYPPSRHGITSFVVTVPGSGATTLPSSTQRQEPAVWSLASDAGKRVGVVNWWVTFPAELVNGFVVSDRANLRRRFGYQGVLGLTDTALAHIGRGETHPAGLLPRVLRVLGDNETLPPAARRFVVDTLPPAPRAELLGYQRISRFERLSVLKFMLLQDHAAAVATRVGLESAPFPDLLLVYFSGVDATEHQYWAYYQPEKYPRPPPPADVAAYGSVLPGYYRYVDSLLGDLLAAVPRDAVVVVVSDHGHQPNPDYRPDAVPTAYGQWVSGSHAMAPPGILLVSGPDVRRGRMADAHVFDVAPTILGLLGLPASTDMPGTDLGPRFSAATPRPRVVRAHHARSMAPPEQAEIDAQLLEKLRSLGYIR